MNQRELQQNIINFRIQKGLTQKQLASELNYSDKVISKWERGESLPNVEVLSELASFFNTSVDFLIGRNENNFSIDHEILKLESIKTESPSFLELLFILPFAMFAGASAISIHSLFSPSFFLLGISIVIYSFILAKSTFETQYKGNQIKVKNRAFKVTIYVNDEVVLVDKSVFRVNPVREIIYDQLTFKFEFKNATSIKCNIYVIDKQKRVSTY